jgi:hypothetical protein
MVRPPAPDFAVTYRAFSFPAGHADRDLVLGLWELVKAATVTGSSPP